MRTHNSSSPYTMISRLPKSIYERQVKDPNVDRRRLTEVFKERRGCIRVRLQDERGVPAIRFATRMLRIQRGVAPRKNLFDGEINAAGEHSNEPGRDFAVWYNARTRNYRRV